MRRTSESSSASIRAFSSISSSLSSMASFRSFIFARSSSAPGSFPGRALHRSAFSGSSALAPSLATRLRSTMRSFLSRSTCATRPGTFDASAVLASTDSSCFRISAAKARISSSRARSSISPRRPTSTWRFTRSCNAATSSFRSTSIKPVWSLRDVSCSNLDARRIRSLRPWRTTTARPSISFACSSIPSRLSLSTTALLLMSCLSTSLAVIAPVSCA
mmetsp:Transcript_1387/g.5655  ORF Transcript_1387/g.5655 Transcript_1387/m.5655 type:complete len:218 (+) Transcript_1387:1160-1813(+)